jgi:hypothetical protein
MPGMLFHLPAAPAIPPIPPIQVVGQQPPGMPFWKTALLSALIGTCFGIGSNIAMEFIKPWISMAILRRRVGKHVFQELGTNMGFIHAVDLIFEDAAGKTDLERTVAITTALSVAKNLRSDRYYSNFDKQKEVVYDFPWATNLDAPYKHFANQAVRTYATADFDYARNMFGLGMKMGLNIFTIAKKRPQTIPTTTFGGYVMEVEIQKRKAAKNELT